MNLSETNKGDILIILQAFLWGLFPVFTIISFSSISPIYSAALSTAFAAIFFGAVIILQKKHHELRIRSAWKEIFFATILNGIFYYGLVFLGLKYTTAANESLFALMEIFFAFLILGLMGKEKFTSMTFIGAAVMVSGAAIIIMPGISQINIGDILIIIATIMTPLGNYFMTKARKKVSSFTIMFYRSVISAIALFMLGVLFYPLPAAGNLKSAFFFLALNGILFFGVAKILWIEGIHRIPITKANSLGTITPLFTIIFAFIFLRQAPTMIQLIGAIPIIIGANIILRTSVVKKN